jgi:hypothetical protein
MRLLSHAYDTADTIAVWPLLQDLKRLLLSFDLRIKERLNQAGSDEMAIMEASMEIDEWDESWGSTVSILLAPDAYELAAQRWNQVPKIDERGQHKGFEDAKFQSQRGREVVELSKAFDRAEEVDVSESKAQQLASA